MRKQPPDTPPLRSMDYISLGKRIRRQRLALHLTQEHLSELTMISATFLGHIERGTRKASVETLVHIATVLDASLDALLQDSLPPRRPPPGPDRSLLDDLLRLMEDCNLL